MAGGGWRNTHPILQVNWGSECDFIIGPGPLSVTAQNPLQGCSSPGRVFLIFLVATEAIKGKGCVLNSGHSESSPKGHHDAPWNSSEVSAYTKVLSSLESSKETSSDTIWTLIPLRLLLKPNPRCSGRRGPGIPGTWRPVPTAGFSLQSVVSAYLTFFPLIDWKGRISEW